MWAQAIPFIYELILCQTQYTILLYHICGARPQFPLQICIDAISSSFILIDERDCTPPKNLKLNYSASCRKNFAVLTVYWSIPTLYISDFPTTAIIATIWRKFDGVLRLIQNFYGAKKRTCTGSFVSVFYFK